MEDRFSIVRGNRGQWELYDNGEFVCSGDTEQECEEEMNYILQSEKK